MTDITLPIVAVITIVLAAMGAFAFLVRVIARNFEKAIDCANARELYQRTHAR